MERLEKILEIKVDASESIKSIGKLNEKISEQRDLQAKLKKEINDLKSTEGDHTAEIEKKRTELAQSNELTKTYSQEVQRLSKIVQNQLKMDKEEVGSLQRKRAELSKLTLEYDELADTEENVAKRQELKDKINAVTDSLKNAEEATQRYYRNVGNYENAIKNSLGLNTKFGQTLQNVASATKNGVGPALTEMSQGVKNVGKETIKLIANPIVATLAVVATAIMAVVKGIKSSEENTAKWSAVTAKFKPVLDLVVVGCQKFAGVILDIIGGIGKATGAVMKWAERLPFVGNKIKEINAESERYIELANEQYQIEVDRRKLDVEASKSALKVAELRTKAKDKERYSDQERLKFVQEANEVERKIAEEKVALAERELKAAEEEAKATQNKKEVEEKIAQLQIAVNNEKKAYFDKTRELLEQENTIKNEIAAKDKARADEARRLNEEKKKQQKEYNDLLAEEMEKTQDLLAELIKDGSEKEEEFEKLRHDRQMNYLGEMIEKYASDAKLLTEFLTQMQAEEQMHANNMAKISADARMKEAEERALDWENRINEAKLKGEEYLNLELEQLEKQLNTLYQYEEESDAEFKARKLETEQAYVDKKKELADKEFAIEKAKVEGMSGLLGGLSQLLEATAGENKNRVKAAKVIALAEVALNQGVAIAEAVKAATPGDPYTTAIRIASAVASTITAMATSIKSINSVKLARGGRVSGPGTATSDSVPAMLSNGEFVVNARATSMFPELLETINNLGLGLGAPARMEKVTTTRIERDNAEALVKALQQMPAPVVSVEEINRTSRRVEALERLSRLA